MVLTNKHIFRFCFSGIGFIVMIDFKFCILKFCFSGFHFITYSHVILVCHVRVVLDDRMLWPLPTYSLYEALLQLGQTIYHCSVHQ